MLRLDDLVLAQGDFVLRAALAVEPGARVAVMGPSGGGKSTLLAGIAGFLPPRSGRIHIAGQDVTGTQPARRGVALQFQDNNLFPHLTLAQNVGLALAPRLRLKAQERDRVADALGRVGLDGLGARRPGAVSGGQQSRAGLARILVSGHPLVLMDEPFAALGPGLKAEMLDLVFEVLSEAGRTLMMITHDPEDAARICGQTILVDNGAAAPPVETRALLADPPPGLARYLGRAD